ncbi:hypothetical protein V5799_011022 [Amblyomma americanum]|uniref:Uncharacterized protein n=1 Tax=Amblyomma americanum TaxID=6943 RepID=A0AAQ4EI08_AMBAM
MRSGVRAYSRPSLLGVGGDCLKPAELERDKQRMSSHHCSDVTVLARGIFSGGVLHLQILHLAKRLDLWHDIHTLGGLKVLGGIVSTTSLVSSATYWAFVITRHEGFSMVAGNFYPAAILSTVTLVWGLLLYGSARHCQKRVAEAHPGLLAYG